MRTSSQTKKQLWQAEPLNRYNFQLAAVSMQSGNSTPSKAEGSRDGPSAQYIIKKVRNI